LEESKSIVIVVGVLVTLALWLIAPVMSNVLVIMPRKWRLWMLDETRNTAASKPSDVVI
jgi:hypothetical protein